MHRGDRPGRADFDRPREEAVNALRIDEAEDCAIGARSISSPDLLVIRHGDRGGAPHCSKGKVCGHSCIAMDKVCHKPS